MLDAVEGTNLQLNEDEAFQRRECRVQRVAWCLFAAALLAAALGLFGGGPLSTATIDGDGWSLQYERIMRRSREATFTVRLAAAPSQTVDLQIAGPLFTETTIERIRPLPGGETAARDGRRFTLAASPEEPMEIAIQLTPETFGRLKGRLRLGTGQWLEISTFIYP